MLYDFLNKMQNEEVIYTLLIILIVLCGNLYSPKLSSSLKKIVNCEVGRITIITGIAYLSNFNIKMAIVMAITYIYLINTINNNEIEESFINLKKFNEIYN